MIDLAPDPPPATLIVTANSVKCARCGKGAYSVHRAHTWVPNPVEPEPGCDAWFTAVTTDYRVIPDDWRRALTEMRPDLKIIPFADRLAPPEVTLMFDKCYNPACLRQVKQYVVYCCAGCGVSHEMKAEAGSLSDGDHPLFSHSTGCDQRHLERGNWKYLGPTRTSYYSEGDDPK